MDAFVKSPGKKKAGPLSSDRTNVLGKPLVASLNCINGPGSSGNQSVEVCVTLTRDFYDFCCEKADKLLPSVDFLESPSIRDLKTCYVPIALWYEAFRLGHVAPVKLESTADDILTTISVDILIAIAENSNLFEIV